MHLFDIIPEMKKLIFLAFDSEQTFILNELIYYNQNFDRINCTLYTLSISEKNRRELNNVNVVILNQNITFIARFLQKIFVLPQLINDFLNAPLYYLNRQNFRYQWNRLALKRSFALQMRSKVNSGDTVLSYWFEEEALCVSYLKKCRPQILTISRAHAFDLYEEEQKGGRQPFRKFMLKYIDRILPVSQHGVNYLQRKYSNYSTKIQLGKLGIPSHNNRLNNAPEKPVFVSCGAVSERKRTLEVLELLKNIEGATWVHFGVGDLFETLKERAQKLTSINVILMGQVPVTAVMEYYDKNDITAFISFSSSEGVPVSMMEAISCGIPIIATNAGGTGDLVNEKTGLLVEINYDSKKLLSKIIELTDDRFKNAEYRMGIRAFWNDNYNADKNYKKFIDTIN